MVNEKLLELFRSITALRLIKTQLQNIKENFLIYYGNLPQMLRLSISSTKQDREFRFGIEE